MDVYSRCDMGNYFLYSEIFLTILGQWPYQSRMFSKIFQYFWIMQHISIMIPEAIKAYEYRKNGDLLIEGMTNLLYNIGLVIKFTNLVVNQHKIKIVLEKIKQDWNKLNDETEVQILRDFCDTGRLLNIAYMGIVYSVLLSYMFIPLLPTILDLINPLNESRLKSPLYMVEFFIDQDKYYYTILMHAYITSLLGIIPFFGTDTFLCNCVHHACGMFTILGRRVKNVFKKSTEKEKFDDNSVYQQAIDCVLQHQSIIEFCEDLNKIYSTSFFVLLTMCIIMLSVTGVVTVMKLDENFNDSIRYAMFTIAQIFHIFCYNFMGQKLLNRGEKLLEYIYESDWDLAPRKAKYIVKFMILRGLKPKTIHAYIFPLTLENFTSVMKTSMSYFTVLKSST